MRKEKQRAELKELIRNVSNLKEKMNLLKKLYLLN